MIGQRIAARRIYPFAVVPAAVHWRTVEAQAPAQIHSVHAQVKAFAHLASCLLSALQLKTVGELAGENFQLCETLLHCCT